MTALQTINQGTPPAGTDGDTVRTAFTKVNSNITVFSEQAVLTSAAPVTAPQALTAAAHLGKRVNIVLSAAGVINMPQASTCTADGVVLLRNMGTVVATLAKSTVSSDTVGLSQLNPGEAVLMDTDGVSAWNVLMRGRAPDDETVSGSLSVIGNETVGGTLSVDGDSTLSGKATVTGALTASASASVGTNFTVGGTIAIIGNATLGGTLGVTGAATVGGVASSAGVAVTGVSSKIAGDYSNTTLKSQTLVQTSVLNGSTNLGVVPNGTSVIAGTYAYNNSDPTNAKYLAMYCAGTNSIIYSGGSGTSANTGNTLGFYVGNPNAAAMTIDNAGNVNIGMTPIGPGLNVASNGPYAPIIIRCTGSSAGHWWMVGPNTGNNFTIFNQGGTGCYIADGGNTWGSQSDDRLKNIRSELTSALEAVKDIRTVRYTWKSEDDHAEALGVANDSRVYVGVIAQDVQRHVPEAVSVHKNYLGVAYSDLIPLCMAAIKELSSKLDSALASIEALRGKSA